ncbi:MAG: hypothetical protein GYB65_03880 [Chloroflexi bacterium]|nr:hypothetical protein [Chloroflexota bacterium]
MFRRIMAILDGTPTGTRGQSLVELTLTLPVLLVMLLGLAEIGWYANNYLTLLDVVREAGRFGATRDPTLWADGEELNYSRLDCEEISTVYDKLPFENNSTPLGPTSDYGYSDRGERPIGFYDGVACSVIRNMAPLVFDDEEDDIAVSIFSFVIVDKGTSSADLRIVGRYPARANECEGDDTHDPFDWRGGTDRDPPNGSGNDSDEFSTLWEADWDNVRGYVFRGNHTMDYGASQECIGSEFSTDAIQEMLNFEGNADRERRMEQASPYGLVLVEIFWSHNQLLGLPWFNLGPLDEAQVIHVWAFFPVSAAEPDIEGY